MYHYFKVSTLNSLTRDGWLKMPSHQGSIQYDEGGQTNLRASGAARRSQATSGMGSQGSMLTGKTLGASSALGCAEAAHRGHLLQTQRPEVTMLALQV